MSKDKSKFNLKDDSYERGTRQETPEQLAALRDLDERIIAWRKRRFLEAELAAGVGLLGGKNYEDRDAGQEGGHGDGYAVSPPRLQARVDSTDASKQSDNAPEKTTAV